MDSAAAAPTMNHKMVFVEPASGEEQLRRSKRMMACPIGGHQHRNCCSDSDAFHTPPRKPRKSPKKVSAGSPLSPGSSVRESPRSSQMRKRKQRNLAELYEISPPCEAPKVDDEEGGEDENWSSEDEVDEEEADVKCGECKRGTDARRLLLCDGCEGGFHMYCLSPILVAVPKGDWFCPRCSNKDDREIKVFPMVQRKLFDFFQIQKLNESTTVDVKRRRHSFSLGVYKKSRKLLAYTPSKSSAQRLEQMASLATAMMTAGIEFSNELTYFLAPRSANRAAFEKGGMQVICKEDKATYELCKAMCLRGELPPLMVTRDPRQGFVVEASSHIKDMTLIAEYTGDVDYMVNREDDEGDSIMGLLFNEDPVKELVICPDKRGNIARFISGINNHTPEGRKKQNLRCIRFDIDGEVHALLVSIRDIAKGERLYYDYNAYQKEYPTEHFV